MVRHRRETYCRANKCVGKSPQECKQLHKKIVERCDELGVERDIAIGERALVEAENKRLKKGYEEILAWHGLSERYYFVPRSIIDQALKSEKNKS